jgi:hypothetical protein
LESHNQEALGLRFELSGTPSSHLKLLIEAILLPRPLQKVTLFSILEQSGFTSILTELAPDTGFKVILTRSESKKFYARGIGTSIYLLNTGMEVIQKVKVQ